MEDEAGKPTALPQVQGKGEFRHVTFGYEATDTTVIHDFSAVAQPGQKIAIVGPTGAGKTTLVNLLMRFHEIQQGEILIDGISLRDYTQESVRAHMSVVAQDTVLFNDTIANNIGMGRRGASQEEIVEADRIANADRFIRA